MQNASAAPAALLSPVASSASRQTGANTSPATAEEPTDLPPPPSEAVTLAAFHEIFTTLARSSTRNSSDESLSGGGNTERNQILTLLAQKACLLTNCASAVVALLDAGRDSVEFVAAWGTDAADIVGFHVRANDTLAGNTARTGEPYWAFRDGSNEPADGSITNDPKFPVVYSAAVLPLFVGGVSTGAVAALHKKNYQPFDGADLMTLSTLAAAASVVVSSHAGQAERAQQGRELAVLYEAVRNVSGALSAPEVLRVVVEQVAGQMESSAVVVWLMNEERTHLTIAEDEGLTPDEREITLPSNETGGPTRWVSDLLRQAKPAFLYFVDEDEFAPPAPMPSASPHDFWTCESPFPALSARSGLACPIRSGDAVRGFVLVLSGQKPGVYETSDAKLLSALASQAAVALENADLYEDATRRAEEAAVLYELSQAVTSTLHLPDVLDRVAEAVLNLLLVDKFALFLHDPPTDRLLIKNSRNLSPGAAERIAPLVGQGIPGWVMEFETPTAVLDVAADHRNASAPLQNEGVASLIGMPLQIGATTMGVLCAMTTRRRSFTVSEMELAYTIANQAALAIENARIYENVRQKGLEVRKYFGRIARALNSSQSPDEVPQPYRVADPRSHGIRPVRFVCRTFRGKRRKRGGANFGMGGKFRFSHRSRRRRAANANHKPQHARRLDRSKQPPLVCRKSGHRRPVFRQLRPPRTRAGGGLFGGSPPKCGPRGRRVGSDDTAAQIVARR